jgi:hypothetical protein
MTGPAADALMRLDGRIKKATTALFHPNRCPQQSHDCVITDLQIAEGDDLPKFRRRQPYRQDLALD